MSKDAFDTQYKDFISSFSYSEAEFMNIKEAFQLKGFEDVGFGWSKEIHDFFIDVYCKTRDSEELEKAEKLLADLNPNAIDISGEDISYRIVPDGKK